MLHRPLAQQPQQIRMRALSTTHLPIVAQQVCRHLTNSSRVFRLVIFLTLSALSAAQQAAPRQIQTPSSVARPQHQQSGSNVQMSSVDGTAHSKTAGRSPQAPAPSQADADNYNTGIKLQEVRIGPDKALKVMKITPGSSAELCAVINVGDRLVKIGDTDVYSSYDAARVRDLLSGPRGSR